MGSCAVLAEGVRVAVVRVVVFRKSAAFCNQTLVSMLRPEYSESAGVAGDGGQSTSMDRHLEVATDWG